LQYTDSPIITLSLQSRHKTLPILHKNGHDQSWRRILPTQFYRRKTAPQIPYETTTS